MGLTADYRFSSVICSQLLKLFHEWCCMMMCWFMGTQQHRVLRIGTVWHRGPTHADVKGVRHWRAPVLMLVTTTLYICSYTYLWLVYMYIHIYSGVSPRLITTCPVQPKTADRRMCIQIYPCILNYKYLRHTCPVHIYKRLSTRLTVERLVQPKTKNHLQQQI